MPEVFNPRYAICGSDTVSEQLVTGAAKSGEHGLLGTHAPPPDHRAAARTVSVLCGVAVVVTVLFAPLDTQQRDVGAWPLLMAGATVALVAVMSCLAYFVKEANKVAWVACPLLAVAAIVAIDLLTYDASVAAQIFFLFPTLYGASLLRRAGAAVMTVAALIGELVVVAVQLPWREAVIDFGYVTAVLVTTAVFLTRAGERQAALVAALKRQAAIDPLTGLFTRRVLDEAATTALSGAGSDDGTALVLLDVDKFKRVNDVYGHPAGDQVLVQLAELLRAGSRKGDVVCRMGGDEIAVLLPGCSASTARRRGEAIMEDVRAGSILVGDGQVVDVSVSVGWAHAPTDADSLRSLYAAADAALYRAKHAGGDALAATPEGAQA
ncbi:GGDEF domain-containing protein [Nocardioides panacis]|uniref:GGDEF domain-containing protein n=1 Tax=Nocardioides panacis TaxID=2849501 RepID=A0A975T340_9ACTN|nr:GGDEF domain-containing protein [Nocardioides panacis]QWZ10110.1 GGDEF domain-containing protein [Nocardioides panacis]